MADEVNQIIDQAIGAAKERAQTVKSARFRWTEEYLTTRGSEVFDAVATGRTPAGIFPTEDTRTQRNCELVLEHDKIKWIKGGRCWSAKIAAFTNQTLTAVFDGTTPLTHRACSEDGKMSWGYVEKEFYGKNEFTLLPFLFTYRLEVSHLQPTEPTKWRVTNENLQQSPCVVLTRIRENGGSEKTYWLDRTRGWLLRRFEASAGGRPLSQYTIEYREDLIHGYIPSSWQFSLFTRGQVDHTLKGTLESCEFNVPIDDAEFVFAFPPNTVVQDNRTGETSLVMPDGSIRKVTDEEKRSARSFRELLQK